MPLLLLLCLWFGQSQQSPAKSETPAKTQQQTTQNEPSAIPQQNAGQSRDEGKQRQDNAAHWSDPLILLQLLLFFAVAVQAGIYVWQAVLMRRTLKILDGQAKTFVLQAATMEKQFELEMADMQIQRKAAGFQLTAMRDQVEMAKGQLVAMQSQERAQFKSLEIMQGQLDAVKNQSQLTAKQIELMVLTEGAYVTIGENWKVDEDSWSEDVLVVHGQIHNGGRTPALNFRRKIAIAIGEGEPPPGWGRFDWDSTTDDSESIVLVSGGKVNCSTPRMKLSGKMPNDLILGKQTVVIDGQCRYLDILGGEQVYTFGLTIEWKTSRALIRYHDYRREKTNPKNPN
jgi:hypothetical protein